MTHDTQAARPAEAKIAHWQKMADRYRDERDSALAAAASVLAMREALQEASDYLAELYAKYQLKIGPFASQGQRINVKARAALAAQAGAATESSSERSSGCLNSSGLAQTLTSETTSPSVLAMREALQAIINLADAGEDEAIGDIARAALAALPVPRAGERKAFLESLGLTDYLDFYIVKEREGDEHSAWLVVMPGGRTFAINGHADDAFDERLASWIRDTLNAALAASPIATPEPRAGEAVSNLSQFQMQITCEHGNLEYQCPVCRALAASPIATPTRPTLTERLQQKCSDWNTYWRAPDAHGVNLSIEQATELLADALGVEVDIATPKPQEREPLLPVAVRMLAEWCVDVDLKGTGWDEWDENYKEAYYRPGPLRELIDAEVKIVKAELGIVPQDGDRGEGEGS